MTTATNNIDPNAVQALDTAIDAVQNIGDEFIASSAFSRVLNGQLFRLSTAYIELLVEEHMNQKPTEGKALEFFEANVNGAKDIIELVQGFIPVQYRPSEQSLATKTVPNALKAYRKQFNEMAAQGPVVAAEVYSDDDFESPEELAMRAIEQEDPFNANQSEDELKAMRERVRESHLKAVSAIEDDVVWNVTRNVMPLMTVSLKSTREATKRCFTLTGEGEAFEDRIMDMADNMQDVDRDLVQAFGEFKVTFDPWEENYDVPPSIRHLVRVEIDESQITSFDTDFEPDVYTCRSIVRTLADEIQQVGKDLKRRQAAIENGQPGYIDRWGRTVMRKKFEWLYRGVQGAKTAATYLALIQTYKTLNAQYKVVETCVEQRSTNTNPEIDRPGELLA